MEGRGPELVRPRGDGVVLMFGEQHSELAGVGDLVETSDF